MIGPEFDEIARRFGVSSSVARSVLLIVALVACVAVIALRLVNR